MVLLFNKRLIHENYQWKNIVFQIQKKKKKTKETLIFSKYILIRKNQMKLKFSHDITEILFKVALNTINHHYVKIYMTNLLVDMENAPTQVWISIYHSKQYKAWPGFPTSYPVVILYVPWVNMRGGCSLCWYWWNCWPSLFKLSFHNTILSRKNEDDIKIWKTNTNTNIVWSSWRQLQRNTYLVLFPQA